VGKSSLLALRFVAIAFLTGAYIRRPTLAFGWSGTLLLAHGISLKDSFVPFSFEHPADFSAGLCTLVFGFLKP